MSVSKWSEAMVGLTKMAGEGALNLVGIRRDPAGGWTTDSETIVINIAILATLGSGAGAKLAHVGRKAKNVTANLRIIRGAVDKFAKRYPKKYKLAPKRSKER